MPTAQDVKTNSLKTRVFWAEVLEHFSGKTNAYYSSKITYHAVELQEPQQAARFFPFELEQDSYFELTNFNFQSKYPGERRLFKLSCRSRSEWESLVPFYDNGQGGMFLIPLTYLEQVFAQPDTFPAPTFRETPVEEEPTLTNYQAPVEAEPVDGLSYTPTGSLPDVHPNELTVRDQFALTHGVACSNNQWINDMVNWMNAEKRMQAVQTELEIQKALLSLNA